VNHRRRAETHEMVSKPGVGTILRDKADGSSGDWSVGTRHSDGATAEQAQVENAGTCRLDGKGKARVEAELYERESTDARHGVGALRSSGEGG
jgi:hypothetical protein